MHFYFKINSLESFYISFYFSFYKSNESAIIRQMGGVKHMNLALLGFIMIIVFLILIMSRKMSALTALIVVPTVFALIGGFYSGLGEYMLKGIETVAPTGIMLTFAILYFGVMIDAGLFEPVINQIIKVVKGDPVKIAMGTVVLASMVALDGDGTTTFIITVTAMMPLY